MLEILQAVVLGIVQGLTEFIPVSSSAHLIIVPWLLEPLTGIGDFGLAFDLALHLGTLVAVLAYFWHDWLRYAEAWMASIRERTIGSNHDRLLAWLLLIGSLPGALAGIIGDRYIEEFFHTSNAPHASTAMVAIALLMMVLAIVMLWAERFARHQRPFDALTVKDALLIGLAQALAILPGVSRSGSTMTMGLILDLQRDTAARFSFLLGTPIIAGAGAKKLLDALQAGELSSQAGVFAAGFLSAAIVGYLCIKFLLRFLRTNTTLPFVYYRLLVGTGILLLVFAGFGR